MPLTNASATRPTSAVVSSLELLDIVSNKDERISELAEKQDRLIDLLELNIEIVLERHLQGLPQTQIEAAIL